MILNITYPDKKIKREIAKIVGPSFSFLERFKMKGIGCAKLQIREASPEIQHLISANHDTAYCNLELRKNGLVVGFNSTGRIYAWCIAYHHLNIYCNGGKLSIYGNKHSLKATPPFNGSLDKKFIGKILKIKAEMRSDPF